jgi:hypothetical protein
MRFWKDDVLPVCKTDISLSGNTIVEVGFGKTMVEVNPG